MKKHTWLCTLLTAFLLVGCATTESNTGDGSTGSNSSSVQEEKDEFTFSLTGGQARWEAFDGAKEYRVAAGSFLLGKTQDNSFAVIDGIMEKASSHWGEWKVLIDALDENGAVLASHTEKMRVRALNANNFQTELSGEYSPNDYFMLEEDIAYYGHDDPNYVSKAPYGYTFAELIYYGEGMKGFVAKPFSATIDGNGYTVDLLVDKPLKYRADIQMVAGALLTSVTETGVLKNMVVNADYTYPQKSGQFSSTVVYKDFAGRIENCWFNTVLRPISSDNDEVTHEYTYEYEYDERASIIGSTMDGCLIENTVFALEFLDKDGNAVTPETNKKMGGAVCVSRGTSTYKNCVFIQKDGEARFINDMWSYAKSAKGTSLAENVYYYASIDDFLGGSNGYVCNGDMKEKETFVSASGIVYEEWQDIWEFYEDEIYLNGALAYAK